MGNLVHAARAKLLVVHGSLAAAEEELDRAVEPARRAGWPLELALCLLWLARVKHRERKHADARSLAREARQLLERCPDPGATLLDLLPRTERALQMNQGRRAEPGLVTDPLSERELTVLRLLGTELSQREIGSELYISLNTVKGHVRTIFQKLGVTTRADAVARARALDLL